MLDASAVVRALVGRRSDAAREWLAAVADDRLRASAPELVYAESASALAKYVRAGQLTVEAAVEILRRFADFPIDVVSLRWLAPPATGVALARALSVYDACYVVLAEARGATLVTADRRLSEVVIASALLPDARPPI